MIKTILIDDESYIRDQIKSLIPQHFADDVQIVNEAASLKEALDVVAASEPDLLLLDVDLGDGTGFDLLEQIPSKTFEIIFITGFDQHAIKAIKVGALDYILKPVDEDEFRLAIDKVIAQKSGPTQLEKLIEVSSEYFKGVQDKRVILKTADTVYAVYEKDIIYCRSDGNYTTFYTQQLEKIVVSKSIKKVQEVLSEDVFVRCHQSYIVNKKHVQRYNKNGTLIVNLDFKVPVSSRRKDYALKKIFD